MDHNATAAGWQERLPDLPYLDMGAGFVIGLAVGYFLKKSFKVLLLLLGITVALLFTLEHFDIIELHKEQLEQTVTAGTGGFKSFGAFLKARVAEFGMAGTGSALAGFFLGLKLG